MDTVNNPSPQVEYAKNIVLTVGLDAQHVPVALSWNADDGNGEQSTKAMLLSLFDRDTRDTLKIDLWTKDFQVEEMDRLLYQTLRGLADTYQRATGNTALANRLQQFAQFFGESTEVIPPSSSV